MTILTPGIHILDKAQSVTDAALVARWLEAITDAGPDGTQVICRGWCWHGTTLVLVTADN